MRQVKAGTVRVEPHPTITARQLGLRAAARTDPQDRLPDEAGLSTRAHNALRCIIEAYPSPGNTRRWLGSHADDWRGMVDRVGGRKTRAEVLAFFADLGYHEAELKMSTRAKNAFHRAMAAYPSFEKVRSWLKTHEQDWQDRLWWQCGRKTREEIWAFAAREGM